MRNDSPAVVLSDLMGCLKNGIVANLVVPHPDYLRFVAQGPSLIGSHRHLQLSPPIASRPVTGMSSW